MEEIKKPRELKILTGFRFFAAMHVVIYHNFNLLLPFKGSAPELLFSFFSTGEAAVSFFFILSGFILTHVYQDKLESSSQKKSYLVARVAKLYPLYFLAFLLDAKRVIPFFLDQYDTTKALIKIGISSVGYLTMMQSWVPRLTPVWNSPGWSLSCEIFFYICFIFLMKRILKFRLPSLIALGSYLIPVIIFYGLWGCQISYMESPSFLTLWRSLPLLRVFEFIIGITCYKLVLERGKVINFIIEKGSFFFWGGILVSIGLTLLFDEVVDHRVFAQLCLVPVFPLIIISTFDDNILGKGLFTNKVIHYLGLISYAIYIIHQPLKNYFTSILDRDLLFSASYFPLLIVVCALLYEYFEKPLQKKIRSSF